MAPLSAGEWTFCIVVLMTLAAMLYLIPSCGDATCVAAHISHKVKARAEDIERIHMAFHDRLHPNHTCSLCMAEKRKPPED